MKAPYDTFVLLDFTGNKVSKEELPLDVARRRAQHIASSRGEVVRVLPSGRDVYSASAGEAFYPKQKRYS